LSGCTSFSLAQRTAPEKPPLKVAISPYQDVAMLVNEKHLGLERKYGTKLDFITLPWEDIPSAIASAGDTVDIGFVGLTDYLSKLDKLNTSKDDPLILVYPALVFRGSGFISFNPDVPQITQANMTDRAVVQKFLSYKVGAQRSSCFQMVVYMLARQAGINRRQLHVIDTTLNDGLLAAENGSLDVAAAGLTQKTEALKHNGRLVLNINDLGVGEINCLVCKQSCYRNRRADVENLVHMWFDCTRYVMSDIDEHSGATIAYLNKHSSTHYTPAEFKRAVSGEYFPRSVQEAEEQILSGDSPYSLKRQEREINSYLIDVGVRTAAAPALHPIKMMPVAVASRTANSHI
jgi:hypothetical protein